MKQSANLSPAITPANAERVYSLDALRGIMMLLGIVLHASVTYTKIDYKTAWPMKSPENSLLFDVVVGLIHAFRMPVFFVAAGFFGALLFYKKGPNAMLMNRFKRILLPLVAGVILIYPLIYASFTFTISVFTNEPTPYRNAWESLTGLKFLPLDLAHLWFLYFLVMYALTAWAVAMIFRKQVALTNALNIVSARILKNFWLRIAFLSLLYFLCLLWMGTEGILTNNKWAVDPEIFTVYFVFFITGWMIYQTGSLAFLALRPAVQLTAGTIIFLGAAVAPWPAGDWVLQAKQACTAVSGSLFVFGFLALFIRYFNKYSPRLSYLMDAAYWVYIIHLPIVAFIPGLVKSVPVPLFFKFLLTLGITWALCMLSYRYLVRGSFIGKFLNGKVYKRKNIATVPKLAS